MAAVMTPGFEAGVLGAFTGAQLLLVVLSLLIGSAYGERGLLVHALAIVFGVAAAFLQRSEAAWLVPAALLAVMALSALQLRDITNHVGSLRQSQRWILGGAGALSVLAVAAAALREPRVLPLGVLVLLGIDVLIVPRAWPQSRPWAQWVVAGQGALLVAGLWLCVPGVIGQQDLLLPGVLAFWSMALYLALVWRSRVFGERHWKQVVERLQDPLTGLATPLVLGQRLQLARSLMRRYGHPSSLLLVHVDGLANVAARLGEQVAEAAALEAGLRVRGALGPADMAARVGAHRFAILAEGSSAKEASANVASRVVVAGLKDTLHAVEGAFLSFRIVLAEVPTADASMTNLLQELGERLDADVARGRERRIHALPQDALHQPTEPLPMTP
jgi:diguanylate cyclase (GGDEF)-like protein